MFADFFKGIGFAINGFSLITQKGIRPFVVLPLLINIGVFSGAIWFALSQLESFKSTFLDWIPSWLSWLEWLLYPFVIVLILISVFYSFSIIANLIASPFNSLLAERVEQKLNGLAMPEFRGYKAAVANIGRSIASEIGKILYSLKWVILLLIVTVIPVVNIISPLAWALFGAWMLALQYTDFAMGNHELFIKEELPLLRKHRAVALGFGGTLTVLMMIPVINFFVMPAGVAGGTAFWVKRLSR